MREKRTGQPGTKPISQPPVTEKTSFLAQSAIFQELNAQDISDLNQSITSLTCQPGHLIYRPGEASTALFFIKTGRIQLYHLSTDGRKLITITLSTGACFGEQVLYTPQISTSFAEALTLSYLYVLSKADINQLLAQNSAIATALLQLIGQRLTYMETQLVSTTFKSVTTRLAELLLQLAALQQKSRQS
ncbi:hypothetical protein KDW_09420 [Dictyobacter vulcani]|uniref:Cyclic nucleotide-binding domain-containing protein n=1 Tax=Dictyobacter vulcani TaxID=2607529 RepID=A0A5J4KK92_9CHLR|nr:cyclic nucleotide-binding domain-containing protein [Dictyobacter vulcani]GER86780.1 hypothetical protein KDW_09420 [Dictyobacter vulcani]